MKPLISVIIPVYNVESYVAHCIESVIAQTYKNLEIILVYGDSTDESEKICEQYVGIDKRIKTVYQKNRGLSDARNIGVETAKGEYLSFIDSDDWVDCRFIEVMYETAKATGCEIVQCGHMNVIDDTEYDGQDIGKAVIYSREEYSQAAYTLLGWKCSVAWNKLYKRNLFVGIQYPVGKSHEDEFTTYKIVWNAEKIAVLSTKMYFYRQRNTSLMGQDYSLKRLDAREAFRERAEFYQNRNCDTLTKMVYGKLLIWDKYHLPLVKKLEGNHADIVEKMELEIRHLEEKVRNSRKKHGMKFHCYLFPFADIPRGSNIILYGAGNVGHMYYRQILESGYCNVILWVDKNYRECREEGLVVSSIKEIEKYSQKSDYLVIAIKDTSLALQVKAEMVEQFHIRPERIKHEIMEV